jgi:hypothetical protein
VKTIEKKGDA